MFNVHNRSYLTLTDYTPRQIRYLLDLSRDLKRARYAGTEVPRLTGKNIALIFEKTSTRTRCAFEVAAHDQGAHVTYIDPTGSQIGHKESMKDTARVLGRMYDAIEYRGYGQEIVEELAKYAGVPVYNGLTDEFHPTQMLADVLTMAEHSDKPLHEIAYCYIGDARNNTGNSLLIVGAKLGMDVRLCAPRNLWPHDELIEQCRATAAKTGARLTLTDKPDDAVKGADFVYTDVWVSMGEPPEKWGERINALLPYQVNAALLAKSGNPRVKFMHCLPAFHDSHTEVGKQLAEQYGLTDGVEVTDEVFESDASIVFEQAENRLHTIKAVLVATLAG
ncbi:ornithine carbamoyltransferase [Paraburkholderia caballeronis]|uniref:Ornithine carbamoyltransferase n=2 Tax=Paraburkholderia caballeronis TaxID=416943 RepID=A0A1H7VNU4_9BURK|nr:ornithine carbamoyltransferase [Paraburkholderia caballeronis]PXW93578.1 ornithine carbamoyltransferase [Paraburkholderia caballeronis]RAJ88909.1 ornithine carbamoyltransferase [Paraburkholderia caballeronis]TDV03822.1 ornithine carbamoyltransferase [Paraburkholderia caballeronis]TDV07065.1 ornithine carbamoyltransferase [Paraburkholderia caballeronis]